MMTWFYRLGLALALAFAPVAAPALAQAGQEMNSPIDVSAVSVTNSATSLLSGVTIGVYKYRGFWLNPTDGEIAVGGASVTASTGVLVASGEKVFIPWTYGKNWYAIRTGGSNVNVRILPVQ